MQRMYKILASLSAVTLMAMMLVGSAQAQTGVNVGGSGGASVNVGSDGTDVSVDADADVSADADTSVDSDTDSGTDADANGSTRAVGELRLTQKQAASASLDAESAELSAGSVANSEDLSLYATSMLKRDAAIEEVHADGNRVSLTYNLPARFLGFIPTTISAEATVENTGEVDLDYPWYRFLFAVEGSKDLQARLETRAKEVLARADASGGFSASSEAELLAALHTAMSGDASATGSLSDSSATAGAAAETSGTVEGSGSPPEPTPY